MLEAGVGSPFRIESREGVKMILDEHRIDWASDRVTVPGYRGHDHFWDRAMSQGVFLRATVAGLVAPTSISPAAVCTAEVL
jgi:hypothetical protein